MLAEPSVTICAEPATTFHSGHALADVQAVGLARIAMDDPRAVLAIDVEGGGVGHEREALLGCFEGREDAAVGGREADDPRVRVGGREREEKVRVDGELRVLLLQELAGCPADDLARAAGRRHRETNPRRLQVDLRDVHAQRPRRHLRPVDQGDADERMRDAGLAARRGHETHERQRDEEPAELVARGRGRPAVHGTF